MFLVMYLLYTIFLTNFTDFYVYAGKTPTTLVYIFCCKPSPHQKHRAQNLKNILPKNTLLHKRIATPQKEGGEKIFDMSEV
jgi:hypothetical protein